MRSKTFSFLLFPVLAALAPWIVFSGDLRAEKPTVRIGSKAFTESIVLGELLSHLAQDAGAEVDHKSGLGGTQILWQALLVGDIDLYVDYTGTIREELLKDVIAQGKPILNEQEMREELAKKKVTMSQRIGFNNTYALGMRDATAEKLGIKTISDLKKHPELKFGFSDEFMERKDGWFPLAERYQLPHRNLRTMDHSLAYRGLESNAIQITDVFTTDAEIEFYKLRVLEDDLGFFPMYYAVVLMRDDLATRCPEVVKSIMRIENLIESSEMASMSGSVRLNRISEAKASGEFLQEKLKIDVKLPSNRASVQWRIFFQRILETTAQHLLLVSISLGLALLVAIPLGIAAARNETLAQVVLSVVGVIQTLPSMALLVFMIPIFGIGAIPAIAALFFYSLLPIVRNTYAGLTQIPIATLESAQVLGLERRARLWLVELPLAMPSILAGIKTAAVINVGTATIGALIGAGGYGEPIITGIRLASIPFILQGAVPAALLALAVQFGFGVIEKSLVSPGLRIKG